jgi:hypothetical protein
VTERVCPVTGCAGFTPAYSGATRITLLSDQIPLTPALTMVVSG